MKCDLALRELHRSKKSLTVDLLKIADRHKVDHEIYHVVRDLARWSQQHVHELAGRRPEPGLLLLADLRHLHRVAGRCVAGLGAARPGRAGHQGCRAARADQTVSPAVAAPDAMGQRHAQSPLATSSRHLMLSRGRNACRFHVRRVGSPGTPAKCRRNRYQPQRPRPGRST